MPTNNSQHLGQFLMEKRKNLDAHALGYAKGRRRTPGLRREEVADRACISTTWYTWLEQGRGGTPSAETLSRIAKALSLTQSETEYLFLTTLGHLPQSQYANSSSIDPTLQTVVDSLNPNPALVRNLKWDVLAWNTAAAKVFTNYAELSPEQRNVMRLFFLGKGSRVANPHWQSTARIIVSSLRADLARLGEDESSQALIQELCEKSDIFRSIWNSHEISDVKDGVKILSLPNIGEISLHYSSFIVSSSPELSLLVYTPMSASDKESLLALINK